MSIRPFRLIASLFAATALVCHAADAPASARKPDAKAPENAAEAHNYARYIGDDRRGKLETVVVTMANDAGVQVELVGAIHIADPAYYKALKELFTKYEVLLFELVDGQRLKEELEHPELAAKDENESGDSPASFALIRALMHGFGNFFHFQYQTDGIDYHAKNFVHADVSMDEFLRLQEQKGESFSKLFLNSINAQLRGGVKIDDEPKGGQLLLALLGDSSGLKIAMARILSKIETLGPQLGLGPDSVILGERNRVALEVFDSQVKEGHKNLGIFYGAAHLPDLEHRLETRGYKRTGERWITAWDIKPRAEAAKEEKAAKEAALKNGSAAPSTPPPAPAPKAGAGSGEAAKNGQ